MKVKKCKKCFLCLNDINCCTTRAKGTSSAKKKVVKKNHLSNESERAELAAQKLILVNYLLANSENKYSGLIDDIKRLLGNNEKDDNDEREGALATAGKFCGRCDSLVGTISDLHQQLEVVQMKLVHVLKSVQRMVTKSSIKLRDINNECSHNFLSVDSGRDEKYLTADESDWNGRKDILKMFQEGVIENAKNSVEIPRVFLDKFSYFSRHQPNTPTLNVAPSDVIIKTESVDLDEDHTSFEPCFTEQQDDDWIEPHEEPPKLKGRKRKLPKSNKPPLKIKDEDDYVPKRSRRSASLQAKLIIASSKRKYTKKSEKVKTEDPPEPPKPKGIIYFAPKQFQMVRHPGQKKYHRPNQYWACATCSFKTRRKYKFEHHLRTHENSVTTTTTSPEEDASSLSSPPLYQCEKCPGITFTVKQNYQYHQACHDGEILNICEVCKVPCQPLTFVEHLKTHLDKVFPCPNCSYCCSTRESYLTHLNFHSNGGTFQCDICQAFCITKKLLLRHYDLEHQAITRLFCDVAGCSKSFLEEITLQNHKKGVHETTKLVCPHCGKILASPKSLELHLYQHEDRGPKPFACHLCSETFTVKPNLKRHLVKEHGAAKEKCKFCGKEYGDETHLARHIDLVHGGVGFVCQLDQCGKVFGSITILKRHQLIHAKERKFACSECGAKFKTKQCVKTHARKHFNEKKFKCQYCEKAFILEKYLEQHLRTHTGEKPFVCEECGKAFNQYAALYIHRRSHMKSSVVSPSLTTTTPKQIDTVKNHMKTDVGDDEQQL